MSKKNRILLAGRNEDKHISKKLFSNFQIFEHFFRDDSIENGTIERRHLLFVDRIKTIFLLVRNFFAAAVKFNHSAKICLSNVFLYFVEHFFQDVQIGIGRADGFALFPDILVQNES